MKTIMEVWMSNDSTFEELIESFKRAAESGTSIIPWQVTGAIKKISAKKGLPDEEQKNRLVEAARTGWKRHLRSNLLAADEFKEVIDFIDSL